MKALRNFLGLLVLVAIIFGGRWIWFYRGSYPSPAIPTIDATAITLPDVVYAPAADVPHVDRSLSAAGNGRVLLDLAHANNLTVDDLSPLRAQLAARGAEVILYEGANDLGSLLHSASALLILAPTTEYTPAERDLIQDFVVDGGRLLLAADPTRNALSETDEDTSDLTSALYPESAIPAINSIAQYFGVVYFDDYLYNLDDNAGNYRNVRLTHFDPEHTLTRDLENLVFFAAHSLRTDGRALVFGDAHTHSSVRTGETDLAAVTLSAGDNVLALGDLTCLTAPYHMQGDNDLFLNHIADWLAEDNRQREDFEDFPYMFTQSVDLIPLTDGWLDPQLIAHFGDLYTLFAESGLTLTLSTTTDPARDALLLGVFDSPASAHPLLANAGITITLAVQDEAAAETSETEGELEPQKPTSSLTTTPPITQSTLEIQTLGTLGLDGTSLFVLERQENQQTLLVLAEDIASVAAAVERLARHNFAGCVETDASLMEPQESDMSRRIMVCSNGESPIAAPAPVEESVEVVDVEVVTSAILIIAVDTGEGQRTGAAELEEILRLDYRVRRWSVEAEGLPTMSDLVDYDAYIFAFGDYAMTVEETAVFRVLLDIEKGGIMLIGEQPLPGSPGEIEMASLADLQVRDAGHALAKGFAEDEVLSLAALENDIPAMIIPEDEEEDVILVRGPDSEETGSPVLLAGEEMNGSRYIVAGFAFYRLSEDARRTLALNCAAWLLNQ